MGVVRVRSSGLIPPPSLGFAAGRVPTVVLPSRFGTELASCPHLPPCPGCPRFGQRGLAESGRLELDGFCLRHGVELECVEASEPRGFRCRARLAVRGSSRAPRVGIFREGTHEVIGIPDCQVHRAPINRVARSLVSAIRRTRTPVYQEDGHRGLVRYLQVAVERSSAAAQVVVVANATRPQGLEPLWQELAADLGSDLHSLHFNGQPEVGNRILGPHWHRISGPEAVVERVGGADVFFPPGAFGQANLELFERIVERIHSWVAPGQSLLELYAGVGAVGLGSCAKGHAVVFNELSPDGLAGLELGIAALPEEARARTRVVPGPAEAVAGALVGEVDHVLVDPPRKGLHPEVVRALAGNARQVTYLSCGLGSFLRDAEALIAGGLKCRELVAYELFPFTEHVETLAHFARG